MKYITIYKKYLFIFFFLNNASLLFKFHNYFDLVPVPNKLDFILLHGSLTSRVTLNTRQKEKSKEAKGEGEKKKGLIRVDVFYSF